MKKQRQTRACSDMKIYLLQHSDDERVDPPVLRKRALLLHRFFIFVDMLCTRYRRHTNKQTNI